MPSTSTATSAGSSGGPRAMRSPRARSSCSRTSTPPCSAPSPRSRSRPPRPSWSTRSRGKGLQYRSPIVRMRQLFDLYICLRPCKAYPGNPLNYKEGLDLVIFRENTEDLYAGVEFSPVPPELAETLGKLSKPFAHVRRAARQRVRRVVQDQHAQGLRADRPRGLRLRPQVRPQEGHRRPQGQRRPRHRRPVPRDVPRGGEGLPRDRSWTRPTSTP